MRQYGVVSYWVHFSFKYARVKLRDSTFGLKGGSLNSGLDMFPYLVLYVVDMESLNQEGFLGMN